MKTSRDKAAAKKIGSLSFQICLIVKNLLNDTYNQFNKNIIYSFHINILRYSNENIFRAVKNGTEFAYTG
jgi:hypothetical protein